MKLHRCARIRCGRLLRHPGALLGLVAVLAACDMNDPPVPTTLAAATPLTVAARAGEVLPVPPAITLADQRGRALAGVLVTWSVAAGAGTIGVDTVRTDDRGAASVARWTLGTGTGAQQLTAVVPGLPPVTFTATVRAGPPFALLRRTPELQQARVDAFVPQAPAVQVVDQFGNPVGDEVVAFAVVQGGGTLVGHPQPRTNAGGEVALDGWRLGTTTAVEHRLLATVPGVAAPLTFRATARADEPVRLEAAVAARQQGVPGLDVAIRPAVRALDRFGNPAGGAPIAFAPRAGSGVATGTLRETSEADGIARVGRWVLGADSVQALVATSPRFPADTFTFEVVAVPTIFDIDTRFLSGVPSARNQLAIDRAVQRWRAVIAGQLPPVRVIAEPEACGPGVPAIDDEITNVRIYIRLDSIDGPRGILGRAGPCFIRTQSGLPVVGFVELDTADLAALDGNGTLDDVMAHEFGHVLGLQAFNWERRGLLAGRGSTDPVFQGAVGRDGFARIGGVVYPGIPVPVENTGGVGTRDSHWRASVLRTELMVGFARPGGMPLSQLTVGALADLGYDVRLEHAEPFVVPPFGTAAFGDLVMPGATRTVAYGDDHWPSAVWAVDRAGRRALVRAGDWRATRRGGGGRLDGR